MTNPISADPQRQFNVLFLCTHNSARSIIAEAIMNRLGGKRFRGFSAGSQPRGTVNPFALRLLEKLNYDTSGVRSKSWEEFAAPDAPRMDFVFTVCDNAAAETCPVWPGQPMSAHWGVADPSETKGSDAEIAAAFADTHRMLYQRISIFINLPIDSLDSLALQRQLDAIGKVGGTDEQRNCA
ncbi:MAG: arsenate reductase ArsC [Hyphomicrobiaceae bacterium]